MSELLSEEKRLSQVALYAALSRAQGKVENVLKASFNPGFKSKYANLASVWDAIRGPFAEEGLSVVQTPVSTGVPAGSVGLITLLLHKDGGELQSLVHIPMTKQDAQGMGSAITYGRRYALMGLAGIAPEDDDGQAAVGAKPPAASPPKDWTAAIAEAKERLKGCRNATEAREFYSTIRHSSIDEPAKTTLLRDLADSIKAAFPGEVKK